MQALADNFASMKKLWLLFSQAVTVCVAAYFVVLTFRPQWIGPRTSQVGGVISVREAATPVLGTATPAAGSLRSAAQKASVAVVSINTTKAVAKGGQKNDPFFRFFFGDRMPDMPQDGLGSGVIVSEGGYVLTNNHVIEGASGIEVVLSDGRKTQAKVIGTDPETDLALLKIELTDLPVIVLGNSDGLGVGDQVLAIGNPFGVGMTVTGGIVSALGRNQLGINTFENFIQTDAAINPGNSGGALVDVQGNLLGINTAIYSRSGGNMGIGFAIPVATAKQVMESLIKDGVVTRGWIGVEPQELTPELAETFQIEAKAGVVITGVLQNGPAATAGIKPGDVITSVGEQTIKSVPELLSAVAALKPDMSTKLAVSRKKETLQVDVTPGKRPKQPRRQQAQE
jgi:Do/DeqQ family serine protease